MNPHEEVGVVPAGDGHGEVAVDARHLFPDVQAKLDLFEEAVRVAARAAMHLGGAEAVRAEALALIRKVGELGEGESAKPSGATK
jgi:hypothetical protein